ncbi:TonB family protein [Pontibacter sp. G13]|uniref:TonB family protein n=1 Tax=Pontibacter sp. G13 TaxID=3074898 RepID=UPI00288A1480|nr:TonB family protein [Pontibacter sp. G13]WNJ16891.1 TonB family protein [Pontibacter sp. G13]
MQAESKSTEHIEDILHKIESKERSQSRKRWLFVFLVLGFLGVGAMTVRALAGEDQTQLPQFAFDSLDETSVTKRFEKDSTPILVHHQLLGWDTIRSIDEYLLLKKMSSILQEDEINEEEWDIEHEAPLVTAPSFSPYAVDVEGDRRAGESLVFTIENFDPGVKYTLDFGNGVTKLVKSRTLYTYPLPGRFMMKLVALEKDGNQRIYRKDFIVAPSHEELATSETFQGRKAQEFSADSDSWAGFPNAQVEGQTPRSMSEEDLAIQDLQELQQPTIVDLNKNDQGNGPQAVAQPQRLEKEYGKPMYAVEIPPSFQGGVKALNKYIRQNLNYPEDARSQYVEGKVVVQFVVHQDGSVSDFKIIKGIGSGCDQEAVRVLKGMPNWVPGIENGRAVPAYYVLPITFKLM